MKKSSLLVLLSSLVLMASGTKEKSGDIPIHENLRIAPISDGLQVVSLVNSSPISANVIDSRGRLIQQLDGVGSLKFSFNSVTPGVYFMNIINNSVVRSVKIQIP